MADSNLATVTINVAAGSDTFDASHATSNTLVMLDRGIAFNSKFGLQYLTGINHVIGGIGSDTIIGNNNGGVLNGGAGNDIIQGGSGGDVLIGGAGNDQSGGGAPATTRLCSVPALATTSFGTSQLSGATAMRWTCRGLGFTSALDILNHTSGAGPDAVIHAGTDDITLAGSQQSDARHRWHRPTLHWGERSISEQVVTQRFCFLFSWVAGTNITGARRS